MTDTYFSHGRKQVRIQFGDDGENYILGTVALDEHGRLHPAELVRFLREAADYAALALETDSDDEPEGAKGRHAR